MRVFKEFNTHGDEPCPICNTQDIKETVLIGVDGTGEGRTVEAKQVHLDCLELFMNDDFIYQRLPKE